MLSRVLTNDLMSTPEFRKIVLNRMHQILKPSGFRKTGSTFSADTNDVVLFVQLQSSSKTTSVRLVATINLGVFSRTIATRVGNTRKPNILDAQWQERIGLLMEERRDRWWEISSNEEALEVGEEIARILREAALPQFQTISSSHGLKKLWETGTSPGLSEYERAQVLKTLNATAIE
jgi:Domain of unknown function (DUF4304)